MDSELEAVIESLGTKLDALDLTDNEARVLAAAICGSEEVEGFARRERRGEARSRYEESLKLKIEDLINGGMKVSPDIILIGDDIGLPKR